MTSDRASSRLRVLIDLAQRELGERSVRKRRPTKRQFPTRPENGGPTRQFANLRDNGKVADQFTAATEIPRGTDTNDVGVRFSEVLFGGFQQLGCPMHVPAALRRTLHLDAAQNLGL